MKKTLTIVIVFLLYSCLAEPKKLEIDNENNDNYNITKENLNHSNDIDYKNTEASQDNILENKKSNKDYICIEKLTNLLSASVDTFETFVIKNGYDFYKIEPYGSFKVIYYKKADSLISFAVDVNSNQSLGILHIETDSKNLYLDMKDEAVTLGFKYTGTKTFDKRASENERVYGEFTNGKYLLSFITNDEPNKLGYSVGISKIK
jgi:hypothetical protein